MAAEFEKELDKQEDLKVKLRSNIQRENALQKEKFKKMKEKYDREGV